MLIRGGEWGGGVCIRMYVHVNSGRLCRTVLYNYFLLLCVLVTNGLEWCSITEFTEFACIMCEYLMLLQERRQPLSQVEEQVPERHGKGTENPQAPPILRSMPWINEGTKLSIDSTCTSHT